MIRHVTDILSGLIEALDTAMGKLDVGCSTPFECSSELCPSHGLLLQL
jgi:hypothetical protein